MELPADTPLRCAEVHLHLLHNFRDLELFPSSGKKLLDEVTYADESEKEHILCHCLNGVS